jgi:hypothetical protein
MLSKPTLSLSTIKIDLNLSEEILPEKLTEIPFVYFSLTFLPYGGLFYRLFPSDKPIDKRCLV